MPDREVPPQNYFPSAKVRLSIRFEDYGSRLLPPPPAKKPLTMRGAGQDPALAVVKDGDAWKLKAKGGPLPGGPPQQQTTSSDNLTRDVGGIIPVTATLRMQGIRDGNKLSVELRYSDFPLDPRAIRSCAGEFYLGTVTAEDFRRGLAGASRPSGASGAEGSGEPLNVVPDTFTDSAGKPRTNLRFQGWVDDIETEFPDDDEPIVRLECSDNSRLLVDQPAPPALTIDGKKPLDEAIANYLANFPQFRGLAVEYRPVGTPPPVLGDALAKTAFRPNLGPAPKGGGDSKLTVWDYIVDVCGAVGHVAYFDGVTVIVQPPHTKYSNRYGTRPDDPFTGRVLPSGRVLKNRLLVYGRNLAEMSVRRRFTKQVPTNIEVRCYNGERKKTLVARYPLKGDRVLRAPPGNATDEKWQVVRIQGVKDEKTLRLIAQTYYETQSRNEVQVRASTKNLASFGGGNADPDLLDLKPGDPVDVGIDRDMVFTVGEAEDATVTDAERFLRRIGYSREFAKTYSDAVNNIGLPKTFRLRSMQIDWSNEEGVKLDLELINYIEIRADKVLPPGEQIEPPPLNVQPTTVNVESE